jgi:hypothetical protein
MKNPILIGLLVVGLVLVALGVYLAFGSKELVQQSQSNTITIPMDSFTGGKFTRGPVREHQNPRMPSVWMSGVGEIDYQFTGKTADCSISVLLSSELLPEQERSDDPNLTSDVTLFVNHKEPPDATKNVIKDNGSTSSRYIWAVPKSMITDGVNTITFTVKENAQHPNGITFFGPITVEFK